MCLHPILIPNPNYGRRYKEGDVRNLYDCTSQYIYAPCGHCPQCIAVRQMYIVQRVQMESLENHLFFATLTYNHESLPRIDTSSGYSIPYADINDIQNCFKRLRKSGSLGRPFRYFAVTERGSTYGRPHAHCLFFVPKDPRDSMLDCLNLEYNLFHSLLHEWRRNVAPPVWSDKKQAWRPNTRSPVYQDLCTYYRRFIGGKLSATYDCHYCIPSQTDAGLASVAFYVCKYMLKPSTKETRLQQALRLNLPEDEYDEIWSLVRSRYLASKHFGLNPSAVNHLRESIAYSIANDMDYPCFINPDSGQTFPLARYYRSKGDIYPYTDALRFYEISHRNSSRLDSVVDPEHLTVDQFNKKIYEYEKTLSRTRLDVLDSLD